MNPVGETICKISLLTEVRGQGLGDETSSRPRAAGGGAVRAGPGGTPAALTPPLALR